VSDRLEWWLHCIGGGLIALILWFVPAPWSWAIAVWLLGYLREVVQAQRKDASPAAFAFWRWSPEKRMEMWAWLIGAATVASVRAGAMAAGV
jgi:hypothetical protein